MKTRPKILYKYIDPKGAAEFLAKPQLRYTDFRRLDDILEVMPGFRSMTDVEASQYAKLRSSQLPEISEDKHKFFLQTLASVSPFYIEHEIRKMLEALPASLFICSLMERRDSVAMWSHYAKNHMGIVFGIGGVIDRLIQTKKLWLTPVTYSDQRLRVPFGVIDPDVLREAIRFKSCDWSYQSEWRLVSSYEEIDYLETREVEEVIVGYRASDEIKNLAEKLKQDGVCVMYSIPDPERYRMAIDEKRP